MSEANQALREIVASASATSARMTDGWQRVQPAMAEAVSAIGRLGAELESGYQQARANLASIRAQRPIRRLRERA